MNKETTWEQGELLIFELFSCCIFFVFFFFSRKMAHGHERMRKRELEREREREREKREVEKKETLDGEPGACNRGAEAARMEHKMCSLVVLCWIEVL